MTSLSADDIVAVGQLLALYGHAADGEIEGLEQVFVEDAVFRTPDGRVIGGLDALRAFFALGKPPHPPAHQSSNVYVYAEDGAVRARSKWCVIDVATGGWRLGDYEDVVVKTPRGWRIRERQATLRWPAPP